MAFAGLSTVLVYKKEKCLVKSGKDTEEQRHGEYFGGYPII